MVTFRNKAATVIQEFYNQKKSADLNTVKLKVVQMTIKLIQDDIKSGETSVDVYPEFETFQSEDDSIQFLPEMLSLPGMNICWEICQDESCFHWTSNNASFPTTYSVGTIADWIRCAASPSFRISFLN